MRPRRLQIEGLRSYRHYVDILFDREGLIAIVGDTGAGKSSILEAITFALYAATSWDRRNVRALISNHAKKVSVTFDFTASGKDWRVTRATSTTGQPVHLLECASDPTDPLARIDGEAAVNAAVEKVVGLDYETFQSAVVLPQGQFQHLLRCRPGERAAILKSILRLQDLEVVRNLTDALLARIRPILKARLEERQEYSLSPANDLENASVRKKAAEKRLKDLKELSQRVADLATAIAAQKGRADHLRVVRQDLDGCTQGIGAKLAGLLGVDSELAEEEAARKGEIDVALESERATAQVLTTANQGGVNLGTLLAAIRALDSLSSELEALDTRESAIARSKQEHAQLIAQVAGDAERLADLETALSASEDNKRQRASSKGSADDARRSAGSALDIYRRSVAAAKEAQDAVATATTAFEEATSTLATAEQAATSATDEVTAADGRLEAVRRSNAAAHAAHGLKPGDPCPVCARMVPAGFRAPEAPDEAVAVTAAQLAHTQALEAAHAAETARLSVRQADAALATARTDAATSTEAAATASANLLALLGIVELDQRDEVLLGPVNAAFESATTLCEEAEARVIQCASEVAAHKAAASARGEAVLGAVRAVTEAEKALEEAKGRIQTSLDAIPATYRPQIPVTRDGCVSARVTVLAEEKRLRAVDDEHRAAVACREQAEVRRNAVLERRRREVDVPAAATAQPLAALYFRVTRAAESLEVDGVQALPDDADLRTRAEWAGRLEATADDLSVRLERAESEALRDAQGKADEQTTILGAGGFNNTESLTEVVASVMADRLAAERDEIEAKRQSPIVAALEGRISPATALVQDLEELTALLSDAKFVKYAMTRKQQALLGVASDVLGSMTGSRYGFSNDFQIIDRMADLPRDPKTLSGGETFLASLALALGLVEIAGRGGGRLDAIFLDEGFGSLDADSLDEALSELERVVSDGRMVAIVSHLKAVAERIDNVLYVRRRPGDRSSEAEWIDTGQRDGLIMKEVEESLLS